MATLTVFKFPTVGGAEEMLGKLDGLRKQQLITLLDAAIVTWPEGKKKPRTRQIHNLAVAGALNGAFWGMLFGLLFFIPYMGLAIGAGIGALTGSFGDIGISDTFIKEVQTKVTPGTSALFLMTGNVVIDKVTDALKGQQFELIASNLTSEQEAKLNEYFAE